MFITFEGIDNSGKSTQIKLLYDSLLKDGYNVIITREPGGTIFGEKIRDLILYNTENNIAKEVEFLLFSAARSQLIYETIKPALNDNKIVLCDRFIDSSVAYQGFARNLSLEAIYSVYRMFSFDVTPDVTFFLDISPKEIQGRYNAINPDRIESEGINFQKKVYEGYISLCNTTTRIKRIEANKSIEDVQAKIYKTVISRLIDSKKQAT